VLRGVLPLNERENGKEEMSDDAKKVVHPAPLARNEDLTFFFSFLIFFC